MTAINIDAFRANTVKRLEELFQLHDGAAAAKLPAMCGNLEKGIYNYTIIRATHLNVVKKWDNPFFNQLYKERLRTIVVNLGNGANLRQRFLNNEFKPQELAFMTHQQMHPEKWEKMIEEKKVRDENKYSPRQEASTDQFTCRKCKSKRCTYYQLQTRSADEPMTTFVTCISCGCRWRC